MHAQLPFFFFFLCSLLLPSTISSAPSLHFTSNVHSVADDHVTPSRPVRYRVTESSEDVRDYWTRERRREAMNMLPLRDYRSPPSSSSSSPGSSPSTEAEYRGDRASATLNSTRVDDGETLSCEGTSNLQTEKSFYTSSPGRAVGKLFFVRDMKKYACSGSVAEGNFIWTASHCVYDGENYSQNLLFWPGYIDGRSAYNSFPINEVYTTLAWNTSQEVAYDYALVKASDNVELAVNLSFPLLYNRVSAAIWQTETMFSVMEHNFSDTLQEYFESYGYPKDAPFDGKYNNMCKSTSCGRDRSEGDPAPVAIACDSTGGASGGPWLIKGIDNKYYINSVNSYSYRSTQDQIFGPYFDNETKAFLDEVTSGLIDPIDFPSSKPWWRKERYYIIIASFLSAASLIVICFAFRCALTNCKAKKTYQQV